MWKKAPFGVVEVKDEGLRQKVPPNCLGANENSTYLQTVLRVGKDWELQVGGRTSVSVKGADDTYSVEIVKFIRNEFKWHGLP